MLCDESKASPRYEHSMIVRMINPHQIHLRYPCQFSCHSFFFIFVPGDAHSIQFTLRTTLSQQHN